MSYIRSASINGHTNGLTDKEICRGRSAQILNCHICILSAVLENSNYENYTVQDMHIHIHITFYYIYLYRTIIFYCHMFLP